MVVASTCSSQANLLESNSPPPQQTGDGSVELTPLQLIRWIDTSPDLAYIRKAADNVQGRYDSTTGELTFQNPSVDTIVSQKQGALNSILAIFWPAKNSIRGKSCASEDFDKSNNITVKFMAGSTIWDAVTTYPIIQFGITDFAGFLSIPLSVGISLGLTGICNNRGQASCNRTKGKKKAAKIALVVFLGISAFRTAFSGVGLDMIFNRSGITRGYAEQLVAEQINDTDDRVKELSNLQNPTLIEFRNACVAQSEESKALSKDNPLWDSTFRRAFGSFAQQDAMMGKTPQEIVNMYGSVSNIPGSCNRAKVQNELDGIEAGKLRARLKVYRMDQDLLTPFNFLSTHFPETYDEQFEINSDGDIEIREGGKLLATSTTQFYTKLLTPSELPSLGFSLFGMVISVFLSAGSAYSLWMKSKEEDMLMSYSDQMLQERQDLLNGYFEKLEISQQRSRNQSNNNGDTNA